MTAVTLAIGSLALAGGIAHAQTALAPAGSVTPSALAAIPYTSGQVLSTVSGSYDSTGLPGVGAADVVSGTYRATIFSLGSGTYDFLYQFSATTGNVQSLAVNNFSSLVTGVGYYTTDPDTTGIFTAPSGTSPNPGTALRSGGLGSTITFDFGTGVLAGATSDALLVRVTGLTGNVAVASTTSSVQGNSAANFVTQRLIVSAAAPEPGSVALLGTGLMGMAGVVRLRRRK